MTAIIQHISNNSESIIQDIIFSLFGVLLGILFTPKSNNPQTGNGTSIYQTIQIIQQNIIINAQRPSQRSNSRRKSSNSSDVENPLGLWIIGAIFIAFLFVKYHTVIMDYFTGFILLALASTITIAVKLYMNNEYDNLNRFWTIVSLFIIGVDFFTLKLMGKQVVSSISINSLSDFIQSLGIYGITEFVYFALGFLIVMLPNTLLIILLLHMFAVNFYLARGGLISEFIIRKTSPFTIKPASVAIVGFVLCGMSLLFTSGIMYDLISKTVQSNNTAALKAIQQMK